MKKAEKESGDWAVPSQSLPGWKGASAYQAVPKRLRFTSHSKCKMGRLNDPVCTLFVQIEAITYPVPTTGHRPINILHLQVRGTTGTQQSSLEYTSALEPYQKKQAKHTRPVKSAMPSLGCQEDGSLTSTDLSSATVEGVRGRKVTIVFGASAHV